MIFVIGGCIIVSTGLELLLPIILFVALVQGVESGAIQNSLAQWFSYWVFTPSFFSWAVPVFLLVLGIIICLFSLAADSIFYTDISEKTEKIALILVSIGGVLLVFAFIFNIVVWLNGCKYGSWSWLVNNMYYEWLRGPFE